MKTYHLDANVVLRFLTQDHPVHSKAATRLFEKAKEKEIVLEIDVVILAEAFTCSVGSTNSLARTSLSRFCGLFRAPESNSIIDRL